MSKYIVTADVGATVNMREQPSKNAKIIVAIKIGIEVEVIEKTSDEWFKIKYGSKEGYIMSKYLRTPASSTVTKDDLRKIYDALNNTLKVIDEVLK